MQPPPPEKPSAGIEAATVANPNWIGHCRFPAVPVCAGGLLPQSASTQQQIDYRAKYKTDGCRFMQPPRCPLNTKPKCIEQCTP